MMLRAPTRTLTVAAVVAILIATALDGAIAQTVGTAGAVNPQAQGGGRVLQVGSSIVFRELITTSASGSTQVIFVDKTTLSVGPNSRVLIDEFVYNPNAGTGHMTVTLTKGVLRMVGGNVTHTDGATIKTPIATIGVRGAVATVTHDASFACGPNMPSGAVPMSSRNVRAAGASTPRPWCILRGTQAIDHFGTLTVTSGGASETIIRPGYGVSVHAVGTAPTAPAQVPQAQIAALTQQLTSQRAQSGGVLAADRPTDSVAVAAGVGQTNANLVPYQVQSVQSQNASQAAGTAQVRPVDAHTVPQWTQYLVQQASLESGSAQAAAQLIASAPMPSFYALSVLPDPGLGSGVPYLPAAFAVPGSYVVSELLGYRRGGIDPSLGPARFGSNTMQAGLSINGSGASQTSTFFVMTGGFTALAGGTQFYDGGFEASTQRAANITAGFAAGAVGSSATNTTLNSDHIPTGAVFDQNARDGATGALIPFNASFSPAGGVPNTTYTFSQTASAVTLATGIGQVRPDTTLTGFVGGVAQTLHSAQQFPNDTTYNLVGPSFPVVGGITIQFDADRGRIQANSLLTKVANFSGDSHEFSSAHWQIGNLNPSAQPSGTYINDRLFAGRQAVNEPATANLSTTQISTTNGMTLVRGQQAFATSDLVQAQTFFPGVNFSSCTCEFTRWGFWSADNYRSNTNLTTEDDRAHLMTWVAGQMATPAEVPTSGTAVYNGFVVGSFKNFNNQYVAAGNFQANVNFASGAMVSIPSLDGRAYAGSVTRTAGINDLTGTLTGTGGATMLINGAFFRGATDPVKDVGGRFSVTANPVGPNFNYIGAGILAGSR